jgi:hypothetical protein
MAGYQQALADDIQTEAEDLSSWADGRLMIMQMSLVYLGKEFHQSKIPKIVELPHLCIEVIVSHKWSCDGSLTNQPSQILFISFPWFLAILFNFIKLKD